jgi:hypothetical protein
MTWRPVGPAGGGARRGSERIDDNASRPPACRILETKTGRVVQTISLPAVGESVAWSSDGTALAVAVADFRTYL